MPPSSWGIASSLTLFHFVAGSKAKAAKLSRKPLRLWQQLMGAPQKRAKCSQRQSNWNDPQPEVGNGRLAQPSPKLSRAGREIYVRVHVAWRVASSTPCQLSWLRRLTIYTESGLSEVGQMWSPLDHRQTMLGCQRIGSLLHCLHHI